MNHLRTIGMIAVSGIIFSFSCCSRVDLNRTGSPTAVTSAFGASGSTMVGSQVDAGRRDGSAVGTAQTAPVPLGDARTDELLTQLFADTAKYGSEELSAIRFVDDYLNRYHPSFTKKRKCLVSRKESVWVVEVINLEVILKGGRDGGMEFHLTKKAGRFQVKSIFGR